jgi:hypothetical protein
MPYSETFTITAEHVKLLRNAVVRWEDCEFGAPAIDCKRPYGNSSVYQDMAEILDLPLNFNDWETPEQSEYQKLDRLHKETLQALQIFLYTGKMESGKYVSERYGAVWKKVE